MSLIEHAKQEFEILGWSSLPADDPQTWVVANVLELLEVFSKQGHSGSSAPYVLKVFEKLAKFDVIAPLTGEADEWILHDYGTSKIYQNKRCGRVFKNAETGAAYDIEGVVWRDKEGCYFTDKMSSVDVTFPYTPKTEFKDAIPIDGFDTTPATT